MADRMRILKILCAVITILIVFNPGNLYTQENPASTDQEVQVTTEAAAETVADEQSPDGADNRARMDNQASDNPSLYDTVKQGGPLMIFLLLLGLIALTIIIERLIFFTKKGVWKSDSIELHLREAAASSHTHFREDMEDEIRNVFTIYANQLERGLALLSGIGNISPIIGFLGTVIGMISAFASIAAATTVNAKVVAVGIQMALVTTAGGLIVAAPTLAFFYFFTHIIQNRYSLAEEIIADVAEPLPRLSERLCEEIPVKETPRSKRTGPTKKS